MAITFTIAAVAKSIQPDFSVTDLLNHRSVMSFSVISMDGSYRPSATDEVILSDSGTPVFAGVIENMEESGVGGYGLTPIITKVDAVDYSALADRKQAEVTLVAGTLKAALTTIAGLLSQYGVTLHASQATGPTLDELTFEIGPISAVLDNLSTITGYYWSIDANKYLRMQVPGTDAAPWNIVADDGNVIGDITVAPSLSDYANRIIGFYAESSRAAYAYFNIIGATISIGDQVVLGTKTYTWVADVVASNSDGNVQIGGSDLLSMINLLQATALTGTGGTNYAEAMTANSKAAMYEFADRDGDGNTDSFVAIALEPGSAGNSIACTTTSDGDWYTEGGGATSTLTFGQDESVSNRVVATAPGIAAADIVEKVIRMPNVRDVVTAQAIVDGYLTRALVTPRTIKYVTRTSGLAVGMSQSIVESRRNLNATCLIMGIETRQATTTTLEYAVTAVDGLVITPTHIDLFEEWSGHGGGAGATVSGTLITGGYDPKLKPVVNLGGTDYVSLRAASFPDWQTVPGILPYIGRANFTGLMRVWLWAKSEGLGSTGVYARLYNVTDATSAGQNGVAVTNTSRPSTPTSIYVTIRNGKQYELQLLSTIGQASFYGFGTLEEA